MIPAPKTWFIDIDGTIVEHNSYLSQETILPGVKEFFDSIPLNDRIILTTARSSKYKAETESFLQSNNLRYDSILFDLPTGSRILINDCKPDGTKTAYTINVERNKGLTNALDSID